MGDEGGRVDTPPPLQLPQTPASARSRTRTNLHAAVLSGVAADVIQEIANLGNAARLLDRRDEHGYSAIMTAAALKDKKASVAIVSLLAKAGANIGCEDNGGFRAIHWAAAVGNVSSVTLLVREFGEDVNVRSANGGETPLHRAARLSRIDTMKTLIADLGADVSVRDARGETAFDVCGVVVIDGRRHAPADKVVRNLRLALCEATPTLQTLLLHHKDCDGHITPDGHFEGADRITAVLDRLGNSGLTKSAAVREIVEFPRATYKQLRRAHSDEYLRFLNSLHDSVNEEGAEPVSFTPRIQRDIKKEDDANIKKWSDTIFSPGSLAAALRAAGGACHAVEQVLAGNCRNAMCVVRPPGHHSGVSGLVSTTSQSCGFCIFNTVSIAAMHAIEGCGNNSVKRVAILDFDVHHGQGTDEVLRAYNRPDNIMFFSLHLVHSVPAGVRKDSPDGYEFYPGTGSEMASLEHNIINCPMAPLWTRRVRGAAITLNSDGAAGASSWSSSSSAAAAAASSAAAAAAASSSSSSSFLASSAAAAAAPSKADGADGGGRRSRTGSVSAGGGSKRAIKIGSCGTGRQAFFDQIENRVLPALRAFKPELILLSAGFDAAKGDVGNSKLDAIQPMAGIDLSVGDYALLTRRFKDVARMCGHDRVVSVLEGGYGKWGKRGKEVVLDRSLLAENVNSHVHELVGIKQARQGRASKKRERD
jgi:acetoin utilization deacetylase AcuC-like enzyme